MGGNTYSRKNYSNIEIQHLVNMQILTPLISINGEKIFGSLKSWRANVSRHLDADSCNRFYFQLAVTIDGERHCKHCEATLNIESFKYSGSGAGFKLYCPRCTSVGIWKSTLSHEALIMRGKKISDAKKLFFQTSRGKSVANEVGRKNSVKMKEFNQTARGKENQMRSRVRNSTIMKEKILSGTFTPNSNNANTHWDAVFNNQKYRSSWEAVYHYFYPDDEYEKLRILYYVNGAPHVYIVDFVNHKSKIATEVKPREQCNSPVNVAKFNALLDWCSENHYTARIADLQFLTSFPCPELTNFDILTQHKIAKIYEKTSY